MKHVCAVVAGCLLIAACATAPTPEQNLAKQLAHCAVVAVNLSKSDAKYKQWANNFMGAGATLTSDRAFIQMMATDQSVAPATNEQRASMEKEVESCQSLMSSNMDKFGRK